MLVCYNDEKLIVPPHVLHVGTERAENIHIIITHTQKVDDVIPVQSQLLV